LVQIGLVILLFSVVQKYKKLFSVVNYFDGNNLFYFRQDKRINLYISVKNHIQLNFVNFTMCGVCYVICLYENEDEIKKKKMK